VSVAGAESSQEQDMAAKLDQLSQMMRQMAAMTGSQEMATQADQIHELSSNFHDRSRYSTDLDAALTIPQDLPKNLQPTYKNVQKLCHKAAGDLSSGLNEYNAHSHIQATVDEGSVRPVSNAFMKMFQGIMTLDYVVRVLSGKINPGEKCDVLGNNQLILKASNTGYRDPVNLSFKNFFEGHLDTANALMATPLMHGLFAEVMPAFNAAYAVSHGTFQKLAELSAQAKVARAKIQSGTRGRATLSTREIEADAAKGRHDVEMIEKFKSSAVDAMSRLSVLYYEVNPDKKPAASQPSKNAKKNAKRKEKRHAAQVAAAASAAEQARIEAERQQEEQARQQAESANRGQLTGVQDLSYLNGLPQLEAGPNGVKPTNR
jgi:hypothetical protein